MRSRLPWILSLSLNAALAGAAVWLWLGASRSASPASPATSPPVRVPAAHTDGPSGLDGSVGSSPSATNAAAPARFHWSQIESADYRQYIAHLRAVGCPERLIRDMVVADLDQLYERRQQSVRTPPLPPWAGGDAHAAAEREVHLRTEAIEEEHRAVLRELLGFAWNREALELWSHEHIAWGLLGFLTDDQAIQVAGLVGPLEEAARRLRDRVDGILLDEDRAALEGLRARFSAEIAAVLTPQQSEEFDLRLQALGLALSGKGLHFEAAELNAREAREIVRLSLAQSDFLREELLDLEAPEEEQAARRRTFEAEVARLLGPQRYPAFARAQDERFREVYDFSRDRQLPGEVAIKAWEIRRMAEAEAEAFRVATSDGVNPESAQQQLQALQESAALTLTTLFGAEYMNQYLEQHGEWLNELGAAQGAGVPGEDE